jgi:hypothetical protein
MRFFASALFVLIGILAGCDLTPSLDGEALECAGKRLSQVVARCGNGLYIKRHDSKLKTHGLEDYCYNLLRNGRTVSSSLPLSDADKADGVEGRGIVRFLADSAFRDWCPNDPSPVWSGWKQGSPLSLDLHLVKKGGTWKIEYDSTTDLYYAKCSEIPRG